MTLKVAFVGLTLRDYQLRQAVSKDFQVDQPEMRSTFNPEHVKAAVMSMVDA